MDEALAQFAAELERKRIRRDSIKWKLGNRHRQFLSTLSFDELLSRSAEIEARQIAHTIDLSPTRESLIEMLVRFYIDDLRGCPDEELFALLPSFELP